MSRELWTMIDSVMLSLFTRTWLHPWSKRHVMPLQTLGYRPTRHYQCHSEWAMKMSCQQQMPLPPTAVVWYDRHSANCSVTFHSRVTGCFKHNVEKVISVLLTLATLVWADQSIVLRLVSRHSWTTASSCEIILNCIYCLYWKFPLILRIKM